MATKTIFAFFEKIVEILGLSRKFSVKACIGNMEKLQLLKSPFMVFTAICRVSFGLVLPFS